MTEQEAAALVGRWERVWGPFIWMGESPRGLTLTDELFCVLFVVEPRLRVNFKQNLKKDKKEVHISPQGLNLYHSESEWNARIDCFQTGEGITHIRLGPYPTFNGHHLPIRRNCWLSGFNIEASAHEKMEWIQGFICEEIEARNLKF